MNKWKIAFWCCLLLLVAVTLLAAYSVIDQAYTITYQKDGYKDTEEDLNTLMDIINKTNRTKTQIVAKLSKNSHFNAVDFQSDTLALNRVVLIFENDSLKKIITQW